MQKMSAPVMANGRVDDGRGQVGRGTKRGASESHLSDFDRFEKRLRMLSIRNDQGRRVQNLPHAPVANAPTRPRARSSRTSPEDLMHVDDTKDRVYIHDLDAELADDESDEDRLIFLPDIEKRLSKFHKQVLSARDRDQDAEDKQLVLYNLPPPLAASGENYHARQVILEARQRARDRASEAARQTAQQTAQQSQTNTASISGADFDSDAMDIG